MKKVLLFLSLMIIMTSYAQKDAKIFFEEEVFDFGIIKTNQKVSHEFTFTNEGNVPLILSTVKTSCGCTYAEWSQEPIFPNEQSTITMYFSTKNRIGVFSKFMRVYTNDLNQPIKSVLIKGEIIEEF